MRYVFVLAVLLLGCSKSPKDEVFQFEGHAVSCKDGNAVFVLRDGTLAHTYSMLQTCSYWNTYTWWDITATKHYLDNGHDFSLSVTKIRKAK